MIKGVNKQFDEKKEKGVLSDNNVLKVNCKGCSNKSSNFFNDICVNCILKIYYKFHKKKVNSISLESFNIIIESDILLLFLEYFKILNELDVILNRILSLKKGCDFKEFKCDLFNQIKSIFDSNDSLYNPIYIFRKILECESIINNISIKTYCKDCFQDVKNNLNVFKKKVNNLKLVKNYKNFLKKTDLYARYLNFYDFLFSKFIKKSAKSLIKKKKNTFEKLIDKYEIQNYGIFTILIYNIENETEKRYIFKKYFMNSQNEDFLNGILKNTFKSLEIIKLDQILSLENLIESYYYRAIKYMDEKFTISNTEKKKISLLVAIKILKLDKIFPLLLDDYIEEIFLDSPKDNIYINHQKYGRCKTTINFSNRDIERIKTLFRLYSGKRLDYTNPNLKFVLKNKFFYCRFTCDIAPINFREFSLDIRKLNKNVMTIQDLLHNNSISPKIASFLFFCILYEINLTVTGRTDSGKTTLINALDLLVPKESRKIYIENAVESLDQTHLGKHQLKFKVDSLSEQDSLENKKSGQIKTLLHRTPDLIYLGEILTQEECHAMFHCLTVGLKGFQTIHSNDINSLINRLIYHFHIEKPCLNDLDIIILLKKDKQNRRKVVSVNQIVLNNKNNVINTPIFKFNPEKESWYQKESLYSLRCIKKVRSFENLNKEKFEMLLCIFSDIFRYLRDKNRIALFDLIQFFDKILFLYKKSLKNLVNFRDSLIEC